VPCAVSCVLCALVLKALDTTGMPEEYPEYE